LAIGLDPPDVLFVDLSNFPKKCWDTRREVVMAEDRPLPSGWMPELDYWVAEGAPDPEVLRPGEHLLPILGTKAPPDTRTCTLPHQCRIHQTQRAEAVCRLEAEALLRRAGRRLAICYTHCANVYDKRPAHRDAIYASFSAGRALLPSRAHFVVAAATATTVG